MDLVRPALRRWGLQLTSGLEHCEARDSGRTSPHPHSLPSITTARQKHTGDSAHGQTSNLSATAARRCSRPPNEQGEDKSGWLWSRDAYAVGQKACAARRALSKDRSGLSPAGASRALRTAQVAVQIQMSSDRTEVGGSQHLGL
ncbi:hypothetical protein SKAU_G00352030 [Synaphobranchus kaupii]|uniref:Uncharacterized protein n=1 Tax=Synaphobranchus kaupii TaxID=118154 RepID=A0A9Q1EKW2_SYNKA|nr:hypothetical protein SKAU_G00352030 [Synaphobranchus kaupii]